MLRKWNVTSFTKQLPEKHRGAWIEFLGKEGVIRKFESSVKQCLKLLFRVNVNPFVRPCCCFLWVSVAFQRKAERQPLLDRAFCVKLHLFL